MRVMPHSRWQIPMASLAEWMSRSVAAAQSQEELKFLCAKRAVGIPDFSRRCRGRFLLLLVAA